MRLLIFLFTFSSFSLSAQIAKADIEKSDAQALSILEKMKTDYDSYLSHRFNFDVEIEYAEHEGENFSGSLIQAGDKFSLDLKDRNIISDTEIVWVYLKDRNELQINDAEFDEDSDLMTPSDIFNLYNSDKFVFAISHNGQENGKAITQIECKSLDKDSEYSKIRLTISDSDFKPLRAKLFYKDGTRLTMKVVDHEKGFTTTASTFTFDESKYEGIMVEDLRF